MGKLTNRRTDSDRTALDRSYLWELIIEKSFVALIGGILVFAIVAGAPDDDASDCVVWRTEARPNGSGGFGHLVHLKNNCEHAMRCEVSTDVNPELTLVELPPGSEKTVNTFRGSPARIFSPSVSCEKRQ
jgi:hypothetical protein